jgi:hypothetical protein
MFYVVVLDTRFTGVRLAMKWLVDTSSVNVQMVTLKYLDIVAKEKYKIAINIKRYDIIYA